MIFTETQENLEKLFASFLCLRVCVNLHIRRCELCGFHTNLCELLLKPHDWLEGDEARVSDSVSNQKAVSTQRRVRGNLPDCFKLSRTKYWVV